MLPDGTAPGLFVGALAALATPRYEYFRERALELGYVLLRVDGHEPEVYRRGRWKTLRKGPTGKSTVVLHDNSRIEVTW